MQPMMEAAKIRMVKRLLKATIQITELSITLMSPQLCTVLKKN